MSVEVSSENFQKCIEIINGINKKLNKIEEDTAHLSTSNHILNHPQFKELVEMGDKIIPFLFHQLVENGSDWIYFHLFKEILKYTPVPKEYAGMFIHHTIYWLQWYVNSYYYENDDIYHGLV